MIINFFSKSIYKLLLLAMLCTSAIHAQADQLADIKQKGEMICGVLGTDEPFSFMADLTSREIVGYDVDICKAVANSLGVKLTLKQLAVAARLPELQTGRVDLVAASLTHNHEREAMIDFSLSTFVTAQRVMVKKDSGINQLSQLNGKKLLTVKGSTMEQNAKAAMPNATIVSFDNGTQAFLALQQGKGVGYVNDETSLVDNLSKLGSQASSYEILPQSISTEHLALGLKKGETSFKTQVNKVLSTLESSGEANALFIKWFGPATKMKLPVRTFKINTDKID